VVDVSYKRYKNNKLLYGGLGGAEFMKLIRNLITWLYVKVVLEHEMKKITGMDYFCELEVEFTPADTTIAEIESREATKH
jgi:hypothetical protein